MRIISFAWTTPAMIARRKHCTRREWKSSFAQSFNKGEQLIGYDKVSFAGGKPIPNCVVELTQKPYEEPVSKIPESDYEEEGFKYLDEIKHPLPKHWAHCKTWYEAFHYWKNSNETLWVVRFDYINLVETIHVPTLVTGELFQ